MTLLANRKDGGPGTHALVIGIGDYPNLDAKPPNLSKMVAGLRSLRSPAESAREFAAWLAKKYNNPDAPIATIELLVSDDSKEEFVFDGVGRGPVIQADMTQIIKAANSWKARGDADPDGIMIFYFCGHGMTAGFKNALLARDAGSIPERPLRDAFDPDKFLAGMKSCGAAKQVYFLDSCRAANEDLFRGYNEDMDSLVAAGGSANPAVAQAVFHSTMHGAPAYGPDDGGISIFTRILLRTLEGLAANERDGSWRVNTSDIGTALKHASGSLYDPDYGDMQTPNPGTGAGFDLHFLNDPPLVPFYIIPKWHKGTSPPPDVSKVGVRLAEDEEVDWSRPWTDGNGTWSWASDRFRGDVLAGGMYESVITMTDGNIKKQPSWYILPPYRKFEVD